MSGVPTSAPHRGYRIGVRHDDSVWAHRGYRPRIGVRGDGAGVRGDGVRSAGRRNTECGETGYGVRGDD